MELIEMIQKNDLLKVALILVTVYFFMQYYNKETLDNISNDLTPLSPTESPNVSPGSLAAPEQTINQQYVDKVVAGNTRLSTADLLPKYDDASDFAKQNPVSKVLQEQNFLQAGYHIGINTVLQSNKIPYLDLRSAPPIPKQSVGPFMNSSYEEPVGAKRRQFEMN